MSADQAFDNLMHKNAFAIPVAGADEDMRIPSSVIAPAPEEEQRESVPAAGAGDDAAAMRVASLFDGEPADYIPRGNGDSSESERRVYYNHPTETDLDMVRGDETHDVDSAREQGARVLGRDADDPGAAVFRDADAHGEAVFRDAGVADDDTDASGGGPPHLTGAKLLRRFAYVPLAGMEAFEARAREMAASLAARDADRPSLAITSAVRGEGRTELAIRLALAMGKRVGHRVLLADFDIRNPRVAARLGVSSKYFTLADVLRGSCTLGDALAVSGDDNLYVLPARALDREGDEVLDSRQVEALFAEFHRTFDFTVVDCGPAFHAEAMIVTRFAGATALAGYCGISSAPAMREAGQRLESAGSRIAGVVVTGA